MEKVLNVVNRKEMKNDYSFWNLKSIQERIDAIEILRLQYIKLHKDVQQGFQRVYSVVKRK